MISPASIATVTDLVRSTGTSAHPVPGLPVSATVECAAVLLGENPVALQAAVDVYADLLDRGIAPDHARVAAAAIVNAS